MRMSDQLFLADTPSECDVSEAVDDDLADAERLVCDLAALLDAGLLVVHENVLGPARYGVGMTPGPT
jgi:hypothetical protein